MPRRRFSCRNSWTVALCLTAHSSGAGASGWLTLGALTYHVNNATFRGLPAGSVLFEDVTGEQSAKDPLYLDVTYSFLYSPNATGLVVGDISGIAKTGHQYLWVQYATVDIGGAKLSKRPSQVNIEKVFDDGDFSLLGIGTT